MIKSPQSLCLVLLVAAFSSGCDTLNQAVYVVPKASASDRATIQRVVKSAAKTAGLEDRRRDSKAPDTLAYYVEPVPHFGVSLGARKIGDSAVVELDCFHPGVGKTPAFRMAETALTKDLTLEFEGRLLIPDSEDLRPPRP